MIPLIQPIDQEEGGLKIFGTIATGLQIVFMHRFAPIIFQTNDFPSEMIEQFTLALKNNFGQERIFRFWYENSIFRGVIRPTVGDKFSIRVSRMLDPFEWVTVLTREQMTLIVHNIREFFCPWQVTKYGHSLKTTRPVGRFGPGTEMIFEKLPEMKPSWVFFSSENHVFGFREGIVIDFKFKDEKFEPGYKMHKFGEEPPGTLIRSDMDNIQADLRLLINSLPYDLVQLGFKFNRLEILANI